MTSLGVEKTLASQIKNFLSIYGIFIAIIVIILFILHSSFKPGLSEKMQLLGLLSATLLTAGFMVFFYRILIKKGELFADERTLPLIDRNSESWSNEENLYQIFAEFGTSNKPNTIEYAVASFTYKKLKIANENDKLANHPAVAYKIEGELKTMHSGKDRTWKISGNLIENQLGEIIIYSYYRIEIEGTTIVDTDFRVGSSILIRKSGQDEYFGRWTGRDSDFDCFVSCPIIASKEKSTFSNHHDIGGSLKGYQKEFLDNPSSIEGDLPAKINMPT